MTYTHKMTALAAQYDTAATEKKWQDHWFDAKTYAWNPATPRADSYVIDTPPPTVSGTLHMGHVFSYTQADFVARFQRMSGKNVFYPMGFDDNGLPTERLVEKTKKIRAADMSREAFIAECMSVSEEARQEFRALFKSIALSVDWDQEYHTISDDSRRLSQLSFLDLVKNDHCYRAQRPFYWDPVDQTAIASAEIEDKELPSFQNIILFSVDGQLTPVMTTRPELLPACVALMYHPDDAAKYEGKKATTPLFNVEVPMVADEKVDKEKGTGLVMCCTFGDDTDKEWWEKHKLGSRVILNKLGRLDFTSFELTRDGVLKDEKNEIVFYGGSNNPLRDNISPRNCTTFSQTLALLLELKGKKVSSSDPKFPGLRESIISKLKEAGLLTEQKPIIHRVKCAERSGAPLEILPSTQWFVKVADKKKELKEKAAQCAWNPDWMRLRIEQWIDGLNQDWCISRQRYFGVPFPVWYEYESLEDVIANRNPKSVYACASQLPVNPIVDIPVGYKLIEKGDIANKCERLDGCHVFLVPDLDVMDTWATSSISPQLSAHGINAETAADKNRFEKLFPADLRPQAHEIIRTWAFYTIVKAHLHNDEIPWKNLMISGWCLAEDKSKMSKSKGNVVTPVALIEERGTDAVRYWAATSRLGTDTAFSPDLLKIGKKLVGKLWNATQFAAIHLNKMEAAPATAKADVTSGAISETLDQWILSRLGETIATATAAFTRYEYADALDATNQFFWADFCDNYLELIKKRVYNEDGSFTPAQTQSAVRTLYYVLDGILKLYAPFTPHVTEELYAHIFADAYAARGSLHAQGQWPLAEQYHVDAHLHRIGRDALAMLEKIRSTKSEASKSIKFPVAAANFSTQRPYAIADEVRASIARDIAGAGNVIGGLVWKHQEVDGLVTDVTMAEVTLAAEADAA